MNTNADYSELSLAIASCNTTGTMSELKRQIWILWRMNLEVYVPTYPNEQPPFDMAILPMENGAAFVFYSERNFICQGDMPYIRNIPFRELLDRLYKTEMVNAIAINPTINNNPSIYSIGLIEEFYRDVCKGDILLKL